MAVFKRLWQLQIEINGNIKIFKELNWNEESLKIEFNVKNGIGGAFSNGDITIYNLNQNDMQFLSTCYNYNNGNFKKNKISLEAGYKDNFGVLINGNINEADANFESVDKSISLRITGGIQNNLTNNSIETSLSGSVDFQSLCEDCAKKNGLSLEFDNLIGKRNLVDFSFLGSPYQYIEKLREYFKDLNIFIDNTANSLKVMKKDSKKINVNVLSSETGLIGKPKPTWIGCNVKSLLNPSLKAGGFIELKNEVLSDFNGIYRINEITHKGSNMGDLWESELVLQRNK